MLDYRILLCMSSKKRMLLEQFYIKVNDLEKINTWSIFLNEYLVHEGLGILHLKFLFSRFPICVCIYYVIYTLLSSWNGEKNTNLLN